MDKFAEVYTIKAYENEPLLKALWNLLGAKYQTRITLTSVRSYQGGDHGPNPPENRPENWAIIRYTDEKAEGSARNGDLLVCVGKGVHDRYGYVEERRLIYLHFDTLEEALDYLEKHPDEW